MAQVQHVTVRVALGSGPEGVALSWECDPGDGPRFVTGSRVDILRLAELLLRGLVLGDGPGLDESETPYNHIEIEEDRA